ncbi:hypothetical protein GOL81_25145 [Sinorhizobium medicae]|nr:hypothetical protein [Sinorhizobium medicae]MDX1102635.1 hypothetical protein [Sinorhizobium medicae]MDX2328714.1 hypothetical protein [Sinorhizobium medicae]MQV48213.1 hypothetical protein [Sinorhizobium medicae]MQV53825.1 hypothetical protein [Sinorhizobium medicae]
MLHCVPSPTEVAMSENRYDLRQDADGTWTVFDIFTGLPARVNDVEQVGLDSEQADDLVDLLNLLYIKRRSGSVH